MQQTEFFPLSGGLDLVTPAIATPAGHAIAAINYEPHPRGYRRIEGIERFDGQPAPSAASYWVLDFDVGVGAITEGQTVTGATSAATGKALIDAVVTSGSYGGGNAVGYLVLTNVTGTFQDNENLQVSAVTKSQADGLAVELGASNDTDDATWSADAQETARALIATVPGDGPVRGVHVFAGTVYAWRNDAASPTKMRMYKSTTAGWSLVDLGRSLSFTSGGVYVTAAGDTITGATSGATALVKRVLITSGTFAGGDAAGRLILASQVGTFQAENINVGANLNVMTIAGNSSEIMFQPSGHIEATNHNFYGASNLNRAYIVDGVSTAMEWDGTIMTPIITGMVVDKPTHVVAHKQHLFLSFPGGSLQYSPIGDPTAVWTVILGAGEIGLGHDITGLISAAGSGILTVFGRNTVANLYGTSAIDWDLVILTEDAGGKEWTAQMIGQPIYQDDRGLRSLTTTAAFGDFRLGTISQMVEPLFRSKHAGSIDSVASVRVRTKDHYRLFFEDGSGLTVYFGRKKPECMPFDYGSTIVAFCAHSSADEADVERVFIGCTDGFVRQVDSGHSLDGADVNSYIRLPFVHIGAPQVVKRWMKVSLEVDANPTTELSLICDFDYADPNQSPSLQQNFTIRGGGGFWDEANWDEFYWSSPVNGIAESHIQGIGRNMSLTVVSADRYESPHTIQGVTLHFSPRKLKR